MVSLRVRRTALRDSGLTEKEIGKQGYRQQAEDSEK